MASGLAKEARAISTAGADRTCSNGRSRKDKCSYGDPLTEDRVPPKEPICYGCGQEGK